MPTDILMPALSPTMESGKLSKWLKKEGDTVKSGDIIAEIETDKATMEVEAADEGVLAKILVPEGTEEVAVNTPIAVIAGDLFSARLQKGNDEIETCYPPKQLDAWAERLQAWASGSEPDDLPKVDKTKPKKMPRDVFAYVIHEGKVRAPHGAMELIERVK